MPQQLKPGLAFWLPCDLGCAVGLMTHYVERVGNVAWMAEPTFHDEPTAEDVAHITEWRWPILLPLTTLIRRKLVTSIGQVPIPDKLKPFPVMRSGNKNMGWQAFTEVNGKRRRLGPATDSSVPIYKVVNDIRLKEMLVSGWTPDSEW